MITPSLAKWDGRKALAGGNLVKASEIGRSLVHANPDEGEGYFLLAMAVDGAGHPAKAVPLLERAAACSQGAEYLAHLARLLIQLKRDGEAASAVARALEQLTLSPVNDPVIYDTIGCVLTRLDDHEASYGVFKRAVELEPERLEFRYNLAAACSFTGRSAEARAQYDWILQQNPGDGRTHYALSILTKHTAQSNHIAQLERALHQAQDVAPDQATLAENRLLLRYALAKEYEDIGETASAHRFLTAANAEHKITLGYDFAQDAAMFDAIEQAFINAPDAPEGYADKSPIFIVGMPRTGTTLVDRILSSHPEVGSAGELQAMPLAVKLASGTASRLVLDEETIQAAMAVDPMAIGRLYFERAVHHLPKDKPQFIDKLPVNFLYVGHILRSLPSARVVCLRRNPMDTVWSNFKNLFASHSHYYGYSYDLMDIARYYARFDQMMGLWDRLFPGRVLQFSYEELVFNQAAQTRRLLEHCGLEWHEACLHFQNNKAAVATPSAAQVRRPLNADAIGRWRSYGTRLDHVRDWFESEGIAVE